MDITVVVLLATSVLLAAAWARSGWRSYRLERGGRPVDRAVESVAGGVTFVRHEVGRPVPYPGRPATAPASARSPGGPYLQPWRFRSEPAYAWWHHPQPQRSVLGFAHDSSANVLLDGDLAYAYHTEFWTVPYWPLFAAASVLPAGRAASRLRSWAAGRRARLRAADGRCTACGYDLRAAFGRCPECGSDVVPGPTHNQPLQRTGDGG